MPPFSPDPNRKVLLIGWDAADWKTTTPLMDAGLMPSLQGLVERGVMGNIATLDPPLSPMLWTSIATGKTADKHGVLGFTQPNADGTSVRPVLGTSRRTKAVWNILNQLGLRSNVVGWWPSHPAEPLNGVSVSNFFHKVKGPVFDPSPVPPGTVHPPELAETLAALRVHGHELTGNHLLPFVPSAAEVDVSTDHNLAAVATTLAEAATIHSAATFLMEESEWDFMAVYLDSIDHFGHGFMKFRPPQRPGVPDQLYAHYHGVVDAAYRFHDMMLGRLLELAGPDTTILLLSDHGFHSDHLRPLSLPDEPAGPAHEHRDFGVFVLAGPGIKHDERVYGVSLLDVAPTLLTLYGLPVGRDMDGAPVVSAFETLPEIAFIDSWDDIVGDDGRYADEDRSSPWAEQEAMAQLVELGYVDAEQAKNVGKSVRESQFYLARVHLHRGRPDEAVPLLEEAFAGDPEAERYGLRLVDALRQLGRLDDARSALDRTAAGRLSRLKRQRTELVAQIAARQAGGRDAARLEQRLAKVDRRLAHEPSGLAFHRAMLCMAAGDPDGAIELLAGQEDAARPALQLRLGEAFLADHRYDEAERAFRAVLAVDPESAPAHRGLSLAHLRRGNPEAAAAAALDALALQYHYPAAHFHLGEALIALGEYERAAQALEVALTQNPGIRRAHMLLADLYRLHLDDVPRATELTRAAAQAPPQ
ncbi:MAG: hypothetical protein CL433_13275 [Acidimicrobiaceae bacterium]|nr:hypothetical protein [Acidimicrobiaceae bacterium]